MQKRRCLSLFLFLLMAVQLIIAGAPVYAADVRSDTTDIVTVTILCEDGQVDLSNIRADVYSAELADCDVERGYYQYDETYEDTMCFSTDGTLSFQRPSDNCSVSIQLSTLPNGYGVTEHTHFFLPGKTEYTIHLETITDIGVIPDQGTTICI